MKLTPVKRYRQPDLPTRAMLDAHPELLRLLPRRWRQYALLLSTLATVSLLTADRWSAAATAPDTVARIAPIFQHGDGRGAFGCDAVCPPVYLAEDEARQVILEEAKRAGINFTLDAVTLPKVPVPLTYPEGAYREKADAPLKTKERALTLDGTDRKRHISFEYVSEQDNRDWQGSREDYNSMSTVTEVDIRGAAQVLRDGLAEVKPEGSYAVFYDPMIKSNDYWKVPAGGQELTETTLAPADVVVQHFGGTFTQDAGTGVVTLTRGEQTVIFTLGSTEAQVNGKPLKLPRALVSRYGVPYVPLRALATALGLTLQWDAKTQYVQINQPDGKNSFLSQVAIMPQPKGNAQITMAYYLYDRTSHEETAREQMRVDLRLQVRDFITWLKAQHVI